MSEWLFSPLGFLAGCVAAIALVCGAALILVARHGLRLEEGPPSCENKARTDDVKNG